MNKEKEEMIQAYKKVENQWSNYNIKEKSEKIKECLNMLEPNTSGNKFAIDNILLMIDELDHEELAIHLENLHQFIMEESMKVINRMKD